MPKLLTIQIPQQCGEDPANMIPSAKGSYCNSCKKEVIDFTSMSDESIAAFFLKQKGNVCGKFYPDQLDKPISLPKKELPWLKYLFTVTLPAFLFSLKANAQQKNMHASPVLSDHKSHAGRDIVIPGSPPVFTGRIIDQNGQPMEAVSVQITNTRRGTVTDGNGEFEIALQAGDEMISLSGINMIAKEIPATLAATGDIMITRATGDLECVQVASPGLIVDRRRMTMGGAISSITVRTTLTPAPKNDIVLYPNPVYPGSELNIKWENKASTDQLVEIFTMDGRMVQHEKIYATGKISFCSFVLNNIARGLYILTVVDLKSGQKISKEFIVQ